MYEYTHPEVAREITPAIKGVHGTREQITEKRSAPIQSGFSFPLTEPFTSFIMIM